MYFTMTIDHDGFYRVYGLTALVFDDWFIHIKPFSFTTIGQLSWSWSSVIVRKKSRVSIDIKHKGKID